MEGNSITTFTNLCKIFEMRIKLDKEKGTKTSLDVLNNYEKYSKKIDSIYNSEFQKGLKSLISPAVTLEKEEDRLRRLIKLLEDRLDKRVELEEKFYDSTGKHISGLQIIVSEEELEEKKERLSLISRYLETSKEIEDITESISKLKDLLLEEENKKEEYESKNRLMEDELYSSFMAVINDNEYYKNISEENISDELEGIRSKVSETKETLDITKESIGSLITNGLEDDYASYVEEAEKGYFAYKSRELILKIYKLVISFEDGFKALCTKREKISDLIEENKKLVDGLSIETEDILFSFEKVLLIQNSILDNEREIIENIANYISRIKFKEERLEELNEINSSVEVLSILREYGLVDTYDTEDTILEEKAEQLFTRDIETSEVQEPIIEKVYEPYRIVDVKDYPRTLNVGLAKLKGESVREKVNKKLNPKVEEVLIGDNISNNSVEVETDNEILSPIDNQVIVNEFDNVVLDEDKNNTVMNLESANDMFTPKIEEAPVWGGTSSVDINPVYSENQNVGNLPAWEMVKPSFEVPKPLEETEEIGNINIISNKEEVNNNDMFWFPVSDSKLETNDFPNLNISINSSFNGNDNFNFPTINN